MKDQRREIFFFTENYTGTQKLYREENQSHKNTLNYINRFTISEEDAFDIAGIYHIDNFLHVMKANQIRKFPSDDLKTNYDRRVQIFQHLNSASGNVHIFISGMLMYKRIQQSKQDSMVSLIEVIEDCLNFLSSSMFSKLRISFMEMRVGRSTRPSRGRKLSLHDVEEFYKISNEQIMSFNNQLDLYYEECLSEQVRNTVVRFFHAQQLEFDNFQIFQSNFIRSKNKQLAGKHRNNYRTYIRKLAELASPNELEAETIPKWNRRLKSAQIQFDARKHHIDQRILSAIKISEKQEFRLFIGYRVSFEFQRNEILLEQEKIIKIVGKFQSELIYSELWYWVNRIPYPSESKGSNKIGPKKKKSKKQKSKKQKSKKQKSKKT